MSSVSLSVVSQELETLTDEERRALRASRFLTAPVPVPPERRSRLAHPGGPLATNKAAALAKFLKRKLEEPGGAASLDPSLVERAVQNAKISTRSGVSTVGVAKLRHVDTFSDSEEIQGFDGKMFNQSVEVAGPSKKKKKKAKKASKPVNSELLQGSGSLSDKKKKKKKKKRSG